jgi:hypothetical protein
MSGKDDVFASVVELSGENKEIESDGLTFVFVAD